MARAIRLLALAALLLLPSTMLQAQKAYRIGAPPTWVKPVATGVAPAQPEGSVTNGYELLLVDRQESVGAGGLERYKHVSYRLLDESAVEEKSQIQFEFDPTYEQLTLHAVTVTRDGHTVNQLKPDRIRVLNRESEMDYLVFDGSVSVVIVLADVKPGDVVDYSFTRRGNNPVFAGHYMGAISLEEGVPVREARFRLLWPSRRALFIRNHATTAEPTVTNEGGEREYLWTARDVPPKVVDANLPDWYDAYGWVQLSDFGSWRQVAAWGDTLFGSPGPLPAALKTRLAGIRAGNPSPEAQVLAALRFVQDDVRYLGVEIGVNSHMPYPVATVLRRGYGDCKDKVQLLVTMLRELGLPARPALVSTSYLGHVSDIHPTASQFDHAIVQTQVDGQEYWLDPTAHHQGGDLRSVAAQFGAALVLGENTDSLSVMPRVPAADPLTEVTVSFDLPPVGKPTTMRVETDYRGRAADRVRDDNRGISVAQLERDYTKFYAESYPGIKAEAPPELNDYEATNVYHTVERYVIPNFWHRSESDSGYIGTLDPAELYSAIPSPAAAGRTMPLAVKFPTHLRYTITARLPEGWGIQPRADSIASPAMRFVREVQVQGPALTLSYEYETLADHVDPGAAADHLEKLSRVRRLLGYSITPPIKPTDRPGWDAREINWPVLLIGLLSAGLAVLGAMRLNHTPAPAWPHGAAVPNEGLSGLRGWLALVGFGVSLLPLSIIYTLISNSGVYSASSWASHTTPGGANYHPLWAAALLFELLGHIVILVFACLQTWLFFQRRRWFPAVFVGLAVARMAYVWTDSLVARRIPAVQARPFNWSYHVMLVVILGLWIGYMFRSERVRNTFVK